MNRGNIKSDVLLNFNSMAVKTYLHFLFLLLFPFCLNAQNFGGSPSNIKWRQINTATSRVIFPSGLDSQANRISNLIGHLDTSINTLGNRSRKWNVVLHTQTTTSNAYVRLAPVISEFYMMPDPNNFSEGGIRWDDNLVVHENRHMQQLSNFNHGFTKVFSFFLGQEGQLLANGITIPSYFFEGDAVWQETLVTKQGRGRFPNFFNDFKSLWLANKNYSWMKLRNGSYKDFTPDYYRLGYIMIAYGNAKYGDDFWKKVTQDAVRFRGVFYSFNRAIERYSGKSYHRFRNDAISFFRLQSFPASPEKQVQLNYITAVEKNNNTDYLFPAYINDDSIIVTKSSFKSLNAFYLLIKGKETRIRITNNMIDNFFSYNNGKIVYTSYQSDPRWGNRDYNVLQVVDIKTRRQKQLTFRSRYFSPDINKNATEIIAVRVNPDGTNNLERIDANNGALIKKIPNPGNYFFTQTKYINSNAAITVARETGGKMALAKVDLNTGEIEAITAFTFNSIGYPFIKGDTVFFNAMNGYSDKVFAVNMLTKKMYAVFSADNAVYYPAINSRGEMLLSAFTADGYRLIKTNIAECKWREITETEFAPVKDIYTPDALKGKGAGSLFSLKEQKLKSTRYRKTLQLFNFHSWRPVIADPEYGYTLYGDNILGNFSSNLTYTYNRNERSHIIGFNAVHAGWFPVISIGVEGSFNRNVNTIEFVTDTTYIIKKVNFNSAKLNAGFSIPLSFVGGKTNKFFNLAASYNAEQLYYKGIGKNIFSNEPLHYLSSFLSFSNVSQRAKQHVNPRWAQSLTATYRHAFNFRDNRKFVSGASFYFPGLFRNHSIVLQGAFQKRDTLADFFSNTFSYSRGYEALNTRRMFKLGVNYQLPVLYPDMGVGNIIFFQRIRLNGFFDYTDAHLRYGGILTDFINRSTGAEIYIDTKVWNVLPVTFIVRYSRLLDVDRIYPGVKNKWEFTIPLAFIPN